MTEGPYTYLKDFIGWLREQGADHVEVGDLKVRFTPSVRDYAASLMRDEADETPARESQGEPNPLYYMSS